MAEYLPPTEDVAIFDTLNFNDGDTPLTYNKAVKYFLRYPVAQGTETLQTTNVNGLLTASAGIVTDTITASSLTATTKLFCEGVSGDPQTGQTEICNGARSGVAIVTINNSSSSSAPTVIGGGGSSSFSVKGNLTIQGGATNTINIATTSTEGPITFGSGQTQGKFTIGGGARLRVDATKSGELFFFNGTATGIDSNNRADATFFGGARSFARINFCNGARTGSSSIRIGDGIGDATSGISINNGGSAGAPNLSTTTINSGTENEGSVSICSAGNNIGEVAICNGSDNGTKAGGVVGGGNVRIASGTNNKASLNLQNGASNAGSCSFMNGQFNSGLLYLQSGSENVSTTFFHNGTNNQGNLSIMSGTKNGTKVDETRNSGNLAIMTGQYNLGNLNIMTGANNGSKQDGTVQSTQLNILTGTSNKANMYVLTGANNAGEININTGLSNTGHVHIADGNSNGANIHLANGTGNSGNVNIMNGIGTGSGIGLHNSGNCNILTGAYNSGNLSVLTDTTNTGSFIIGVPITMTATPILPSVSTQLGYNTAVTSTTAISGIVRSLASTNLGIGVWMVEGCINMSTSGGTGYTTVVSVSTTNNTLDTTRMSTFGHFTGALTSQSFSVGATVITNVGPGLLGVYVVGGTGGTVTGTTTTTLRITRIA